MLEWKIVRCLAVATALLMIGLHLAFAAPPPAPPSSAVPSTPAKVEVRREGEGYGLYVDGAPFFIQGAGGSASPELLKARGGNALRTWGADDIDAQLDRAHRLGLKVVVGIWLEHIGQGPLKFDYHNPKHTADQLEKARQAILRYRNHPAVLVWGIGNEMEGEKGDDPAIWANVQAIAALAKQLDPNHPTMTVIAEMGGVKIPNIHKYCPDIDIVGVNSYAGGTSVARRYRQLGGTKPYILTEFGPFGTWEVAKKTWGAPIEPTSTEKAESYRNTYEQSVLAERGKLCLGSFAFLWGNKEEATATWFGMLLKDGSVLESVDTMTELWTGKPPEARVPKIRSLTVDREQVRPGGTIRATLDVFDPADRPLRTEWVLTQDPGKYVTMGQFQHDAAPHPEALFESSLTDAELHMPSRAGPYWLYAYVRNDRGGAATAVVPLLVTEKPAPARDATPAALKSSPAAGLPAPVVIYGDGLTNPLFAFSGWMGETAAIKVDEAWGKNPHSGRTCMRVEFSAPSGFGAVAAQNPANDWGDLPGHVDLTGARKLTFWARGESGGERVIFRMGILGADKKYPDSASAESPEIRLTSEWKQYSIDLTGKDLSRVKTAFVWAVSGQGKPVVFYLDDIRYE